MPTLRDPIAFSLGPLDIRWYALFLLAGIVAALGLSYWLAAQRGLEAGFVLDLAPPVVLISVAGARLYYVLLEWDRFDGDIGAMINVRSGGLSIHGGIVAGVVSTLVLCRFWKQPALLWMDILAPGLALGQAIGRWGNWANQEAFGRPTDLPWAVTIDPARRPGGYEAFETYHPTYLYESLFNVVNATFLAWLVVRGPRQAWMRTGDVVAAYLIGYGIARLVIERIRLDSLYIGVLPAAYWFSGALILAGIVLAIVNRRSPSKRLA